MHKTDVASRFQHWTAISSLALIGVTWRLWTPQTVYPQVPIFEFLCDAPGWLDWLTLCGAVVGLLALVLSHQPRRVQFACAAVGLSLLVSISLDQHRFQPWAYELWLFCVLWICSRADVRLRLMRWLMISIYCYSAVGKLDFEFLHTVGQQMLTVFAGGLRLDVAQLSMSSRVSIASLFPLAELVIGIALAWPRTRRLAGWFAVGLHLGLILILGPLGLNHRLGVLVWNAQVALQAYWLFVTKQVVEPEENLTLLTQVNTTGRRRGMRQFPQWFGTTIIVLAIILPSTERFGIWDHWPSWALYAPHSSRVHIEIAAPAVWQLPETLQALIHKPSEEDEEIAIWKQVPIDAWSLQSLGTPVYPQARFQLGVAEQIASQLNSEFQVRVRVLGSASRFTGKRQTATYEGLVQVKNASKRFLLNHHPRRSLTRR